MRKTTDQTKPGIVPTLALTLVYFAAVSPVLGDDESPPSTAALQRMTWAIGAEIYNFTYEESVMDEEGVFYGINLGYTVRNWVPDSQNQSLPDGGSMFGFEARVAVGQVDYDGQLDDGTPYAIDNIDDYALEARAILGRDWLGSDTISTIYTGFGYRYLNDDLSSDPAGYERESNYIYLPVGYKFDAGLDKGWSWGGRIEYDIFLWGLQRSYLSDVDPSQPDVDNNQHNGYGYRASVRLQNEYSDGILIIEPFLRFWEIEDSDISLNILEPANETMEYGIQLIWMF